MAAAFSPDGRTVAARKAGAASVWFWAVDTGVRRGSFQIPEHIQGRTSVVCFSPDSSQVAVSLDRVVHRRLEAA